MILVAVHLLCACLSCTILTCLISEPCIFSYGTAKMVIASSQQTHERVTVQLFSTESKICSVNAVVLGSGKIPVWSEILSSDLVCILWQASAFLS